MARNYYDDSYEEYDDYECESYDGGYEWTEEDSWYALTDGMYGDYKGGDDFEFMVICPVTLECMMR